MRIFHPIKSLVVGRNMWLLLFINIWLFLNKSNVHLKSLKFWGCQICVFILFSCFSGCWVFLQFCDFSLYKSCKTYQGPVLPPGSRNWRQIYPHSKLMTTVKSYIVESSFISLGINTPMVYLFWSIWWLYNYLFSNKSWS